MIRAFVAVTLEDPVVRRRLAGARSLLPPLRGVRWIPEAQLHFTLKFLGEIPAESLEAAKAATVRAASSPDRRRRGPFRVDLVGLGAFPPQGAVRVVWAGCGEGAEALGALASDVEEAFATEGFPAEDRPFAPHLTLARVKDPVAGRRLSRELSSVPSEPFGSALVRSLVLFRSDRTPRGAEYAELLRVALESPAAPQ